MPDGAQLRKMSVRDGIAVGMALKQGFRVVIISGGREESVRKRFEYLGVTDVYLGISDKLDVLDEYLLTWDIKAKNVLYMGDDLPDYAPIQYCGIGTCPNNAAVEIKAISDYISPYDGGTGCVRDIIEKTMRVQGKWFEPPAESSTDSTESL